MGGPRVDSLAVRPAAGAEQSGRRSNSHDHRTSAVTGTTALAARQHALRRVWTRAAAIDPRYLIAFLITLVLVVAQFRYHMVGGYSRLAVALLTCCVAEALISWFVRGKVVNLLSAYISGLSLTLLIKPQAEA